MFKERKRMATSPTKSSHRRKTSYDMGYGDFYFGRRDCRHWGPRIINITTEDLMRCSDTLSESYPGTLERTKNFFFFDLPEHVRDKILGYLVQPLTFNNGAAIQIEIHRGPRFFPSDQQEDLKLIALHPHRNDKRKSYGMVISSTRESADLKLLLDLSNVSTQFRYELAKIFWKSISIDCQENKHRKELLHFLEDRPSIYAGIKNLRIRHNMTLGDNRYTIDGKEYAEFCVFAAENLRLDYFYLEIRFWDDELEALADRIPIPRGQGGDLKWLDSTQSLNVIGTFKLSISVAFEQGAYWSAEETEAEEKRRLAKYLDKLQKRLMPRSLMPAPPTTEEGKYLHNRSLLVPYDEKSPFRRHVREG